MIVVLMGVAGSGKTTVGRRLADALGCSFVEGDAFHPSASVEKMKRGAPLTDADRMPWLDALRQHLDGLAAQGQSAVVACSALKAAYRARLLDGLPEARLVYLRGDYDLIRQRLEKRPEHFFRPALLRSQFDALEEPADALAIDIGPPPESIALAIQNHLGV